MAQPPPRGYHICGTAAAAPWQKRGASGRQAWPLVTRLSIGRRFCPHSIYARAMFDIRFLHEPNSADASTALGQIVLSDHTERFRSELTHWSRTAYERSWDQALRHFAVGADRTVLVTCYNGPDAGHHFAWVLWRIGDYAVFQEQLYLVGDMDPELDPERPWNSAPERKTFSEEGFRIAEWRLPLAEVMARAP